MKEVIKDGYPLLLLSDQEWIDVFASKTLEGKALSAFFLKKAELDYSVSSKYEEINLYIAKILDKFFVTRPLLLIDNYEQRVFLETITCGTCLWTGMAAEPLSIENYVEISKEIKKLLLDKAMSFRVIPCPVCGTKLPRHCIWVEH
jgi:uncharacterized protein (DUF2225 family)